MLNHSIKKRFLYTLFSNIVQLFGNIVVATIVPRALGPSHYGSFNFLMVSFKTIRGFFDLSVCNAFYNYNSRFEKSDIIVFLYGVFLVIEIIAVLGVVFFSTLTGYNKFFWPGQEIKYLWLIAGLEFFTFVSQQCILFGDSKGVTVYTRMISLIVYLGGTILLLLLYFIGKLNLNTFIYIKYFTVLITSLALTLYFYNNQDQFFSMLQWGKKYVIKILKYVYRYCSPLIILAISGLAFTYFDRWLLQYIKGSTEQGYYSISFQWATVVIIFTTSIIHIYWKEAASAFEANNKQRIVHLYKKASYFLYSIASMIASFVFINSSMLVSLFGSQEYNAAVTSFMVMSFYPIHQTFGQLNGTLFQATGRIHIHRNIGITGHILGILTTYFLLAPDSYVIPGMNLGATGLALKMVSVQVIMINVQIYFHTKYLKLKYYSFVFHQIFAIGFYLLLGIGNYYFLQNVLNINDDLWGLIVQGIFYIFVSAMITYNIPSVIGFANKDIQQLKSAIKNKLPLFSAGNI